MQSKIAVDAMGGDYAPQEVILGCLDAAKKGIPLVLFGNQDKVVSLLTYYCASWRALPIELVHCADVVDMDDDPVKSILRKKDSSIIRGLQAVKALHADAFVSAGNSGAVIAAASTIIGRVSGVIRPAIGSFLPTTGDASLFCLDLGANPDCRPENLVQFAFMGHAYVRLVKQIAQPKIGLLANGHEQSKGSLLTKKAYELLENSSLEFMGNIESRDIFSGRVDVVVTDGFTGNILLKAIQGTAQAVMDWMKSESSRSLVSKIVLGLSKPFLNRIKQKIDYARTGGALLLGVNQPVIIAHGSSRSLAITQAIIFAHRIVQDRIVTTFNDSLKTVFSKHQEASFLSCGSFSGNQQVERN